MGVVGWLSSTRPEMALEFHVPGIGALAKDVLTLSLLVRDLHDAGTQLLALSPHDTWSLSDSSGKQRQ
ncbi:hypothetical protein GUJ93_ZPchr0014g47144 [Zizania palustris]|uniref:Uncharacterized protein n=1 Tax=Zizania palustris TaxID=103762 RepID=A0A8J5TKV7_ZIZPA|nr:hypothetical protein GUJ93_ZPchr0014g47144 [Zizania palustris]